MEIVGIFNPDNPQDPRLRADGWPVGPCPECGRSSCRIGIVRRLRADRVRRQLEGIWIDPIREEYPTEYSFVTTPAEKI